MLNSKDILELELMLHNGFMKWRETQTSPAKTHKLMDMYLKEIEQLSLKKNYA